MLSRKLPGEDWQPWRRRQITGTDYSADLYLYAGMRDPAEIPGGECWRLETMDAAGNMGEASLTVCEPCLYRAEEGEVEYEIGDLPQEPTWAVTDDFPGGACDAISDPPYVDEGGNEEEPDDEPDDGEIDDEQLDEGEGDRGAADQSGAEGARRQRGGCSANAGAPGALWMLGLLGLLGIRRR